MRQGSDRWCVAGGRRALRLIAVAAFCCLAVARAAGGAPSNDAFAAAQALGGATGTVGGSNVDATHSFRVQSVDPAKNVDATPASSTWTIDAPPIPPAPPETTITSGPASPTASTGAMFSFF